MSRRWLDHPVTSGVMTGIRSAVGVSSAEYLPVGDVPRAGHLYVADGGDACAEGDVAVDLEAAAAAQRRRAGPGTAARSRAGAGRVGVEGDGRGGAVEAGLICPSLVSW